MAGARRYAAFLRGVSPMNARMPELRRAFEAAGFEDVETVASSGNVVFTAPEAAAAALERRAEAAMRERLGTAFVTFVRRVDALAALLESDPWPRRGAPPRAKRVVTFLRRSPEPPPRLPVALDGARILRVVGGEALSIYVPGPRGPAFMTLIERTFGKDVTTRTWEMVARVARRGEAARPTAERGRRRPTA